MELLNQPFSGQLGDRLIELLDSPEYHTLDIVVAFAKNSGVLRIRNALKAFREKGGKVNIYVGVDLGGTSYEALTNLRLHSDRLNVVHSERGQTFHSKIYKFSGHKSGLIIVGSHNLTGGGLWTNFESSIHASTGGTNADNATLHNELDEYFKELSSLEASFLPITSQNDIETLLQNDYVTREVADQIRRSKAAKQLATKKRLFGNGVSVRIPKVTTSGKGNTKSDTLTLAAPILSAEIGEDKTIWFETGKMTGGSRNILDLSKKSLIEDGDPRGTAFDLGEDKFMRGSVEFFGIDPTANDQTRSITINFEGSDYSGNTILFPEGNKANGTWRLQIKGNNSSDQKITEAFREKGESPYLVKKIVTFTKVQRDYYAMAIFPEAALDEFKAASTILARNGQSRTARLLGLL